MEELIFEFDKLLNRLVKRNNKVSLIGKQLIHIKINVGDYEINTTVNKLK